MPKGTRMEQDDANYILIWGQAKYNKLMPYNHSFNVPIMYTASSFFAYHAFATTFEALEVYFFRREKVLQSLGVGTPSMSLTLFLKSLWQKKTSIIARTCQQVRESTWMTRW
jgi:hypothetical protein